MAQEVMCIFFRASDGKRAGDLSRNMQSIDHATDGATARGLMTDPRDSSVYVLSFPPDTQEEEVLRVSRNLEALSDPADNEPLLEAWRGRMSAGMLACTHFDAKMP